MKKVLCIITAIVLCMSMTCTVFAANDSFVDSITYKDEPEVETTPGGGIGTITDGDGNKLDDVDEDCIVITPISEAEESDKIPQDAKDELLDLYDQLTNGEMHLPYDQVPGYNGDDMVIRELFDMSWLCDDHEAMVEPTGVTVNLSFDLGVPAGVNVIAMLYVDGQWIPVAVVNNGDGTVSCAFEKLGVVAFSVPYQDNSRPSQTGDNANLTMWITLLCVSAVALTVVVVCFTKKNKRA